MFEYDLEKLLKKFPLPDGVADAVVNRAELAEALNKSANTIDDYRRNKNMPMHSEGGNGTAYEFSLSECYAWYMGWKENEATVGQQKKSSINQMRMALVNSDGGELEEMSPQERKHWYEAEEAFMKSAYSRRTLIKRGDVIRGLEKIFSLVKQQYETLPDILEKKLGLTPVQLEEIVTLSHAQQENFYQTVLDSGLIDDDDKTEIQKAAL